MENEAKLENNLPTIKLGKLKYFRQKKKEGKCYGFDSLLKNFPFIVDCLWPGLMDHTPLAFYFSNQFFDFLFVRMEIVNVEHLSVLGHCDPSIDFSRSHARTST